MVQKRANIKRAVVTTFPDVHKYIIEKLEGRNDCIGRKGSYLKVFQSALHYSINEKSHVKQKLRLFESSIIIHWFYFLFLYFRTILESKRISSPTVFLDPGRVSKTGNSIFFSKIRECFDQEELMILVSRRLPTFYQEYNIEDYESKFVFPGLKLIKQMIDLRLVYKKAKQSKRWSSEELHYLDSSLHSFLNRYSKCLGSYDEKRIRKVFFVVHYLNEGFISAMADLGIKTIELQHGLISTIDIYYVYSEAYRPWIKKMFLPEYLFVFGDLWRKRLLGGIEWSSDKIVTMGDYTELFTSDRREKIKENVILMCAQKRLYEEYTAWISCLSKLLQKYPNWRMVVKLHPYEPEQDIPKYYALQNDQVMITQTGSLDEWFSIAKIQLSVYSTTFYDAIGYDIMNYALINTGTYDAYVDEMIAAEVAVGIEMQDDPIARFLQEGVNSILINKSSIYGQWDQQRFNHFLTNAE